MHERAPAPRAPENEEEIESKRQAELDKFGYAGIEELAHLENNVRMLEAEVEKDSGNEASKKELELENRKLDLFLTERDNAGAFKFKRFGRELRSSFEDGPDGPKRIELDAETGRMTMAESEKNRRLMFVNMGELDRFNKEGGGHAAGDAALADASRTIEKIVRGRLLEKQGAKTGYELLRYSGNEFMVSFDDISQDDLDAIIQEVSAAKPGADIPGVKEGAPLTAVSFAEKETGGEVTHGGELGEAMKIVEQLQLQLGEDERVSTPDEANREIIEVTRQLGNYSLDVAKFTGRVERIREKLRTEDRVEVQKFFDNYMAKMFAGTSLDSLDKFADLDKLPDARSAIGEIALGATNQRRSIDREKSDLKQNIIDARVKEIRDKREAREPQPKLEQYGPTVEGDVRIADVPAETSGQKVLREKKEVMERAVAADPEGHDAQMAKLDHQIEVARRDQGTGLLERGIHYETLEKKIKNGEKTSLVFVDMGFLKYFDQRGGSDVGDKALKLAAEMMVNAIKESGVKGEAFRYGGDEFTVQIDGGPAEVAKFQEKLQELRTSAGGVDVGKRGIKDDYYPSELVFNYGVADTEMAEQAFESLKEAGLYDEAELSDPERVANLKADVMTVIADKSIESEKAVNRFSLLLEKMQLVEKTTDPARKERLQRQVSQLTVFSSKAVFAEAGGGAQLGIWAASGESVEDLRPQIEDWVAERIQENREKDKGQKDLREQLVEIHVRVWHYQQEIARLSGMGEKQATRIELLEKERDQAKKERQELLDVRKKLE